MRHSPVIGSNEETEKLPPALAKHLEQLSKAIPENGGESEGGNGGAGDQELRALAYPDNDISLAEINAAASSFSSVKKRGFPKGVGGQGSWVSVGPTYAAVPFFKGRDTTLYVPNGTTAGGRTTSLAISPNCNVASCRLWLAAAGGGIWRTDKALTSNPVWTYLSGSFEVNSSDTIFQDPNDPTGETLYVGTGEGSACGDCAFGVGIYKTTDGGNHWTGPIGKSYFNARAVTSIAIPYGQPDVIYAGVVRASNGIASVNGGGVTITVPGAQLWGLWKSTNGGATFTYIHDGSTNVATCAALTPAQLAASGVCSQRGTRRVAVDSQDANTVYASSYGRGIWRSSDAGATWTQIKSPASTGNTFRSEFAITLLSGGATRMYTVEGTTGSPAAFFSRSDDVRTGVPSFNVLSSNNPANSGFGAYNTCTAQCWYDNFVFTPPGHPEVVLHQRILQLQ